MTPADVFPSAEAVMTPVSQARPVGQLLRSWRERRRLSQLELSHSVDVSTRHLSYLETGRAQPSRAMVLRLAEHLDVPLRDRNRLLLSAGFAPVYSEAGPHSPQLAAVRAALRGLLAGHEPNPGLVVDRCWNLVEANAPVHRMLATVDPELLRPPVNVLRLALHPDALASRCLNLPEFRSHLLHRLQRQVVATADPELVDLLAELRSYPGGGRRAHGPDGRRGRRDVADRLRGAAAGAAQHRGHFRYAGGHHGLRAGDRAVLPGRPADRRGAPGDGRRLIRWRPGSAARRMPVMGMYLVRRVRGTAQSAVGLSPA